MNPNLPWTAEGFSESTDVLAGEQYKFLMSIPAGVVVLVSQVGYTNGDSLARAIVLANDPAGFGSALSLWARTVSAGATIILWPGSPGDTIVTEMKNTILLVGPCEFTAMPGVVNAANGTHKIAVSWLEAALGRVGSPIVPVVTHV